jgi:hypothetical protein
LRKDSQNQWESEPMRSLTTLLFGAVLLASPSSLFAQTKPAPKPAPIAPAAPLKDGWEEIDKRLIFLMVRLANVEASLDAVEKSAGTGSRQQSARLGDAKRAERANELMDRKGGGPVKWSQFYGSTAEKFFYHPTDANTTYHTTTVLSQQSPANDNQVEQGIPSRQGVPVHQRPPQFDYIYKANRDAQARAEQEASQLRNKVDALQARRRQLEDEQAALWCQIAFRVVSRHDLPRHPRYRFEPIPFNADTASQQQAVAAEAAALYMRHALSIIEEAEKDQGKAFGSIKSVVADAREKFEDALLRLDTLREDTTDLKTAIGRYSALARRLQDIADNISDSYEVSIDGDRFKDELRKDTFRGLLQQSLVDYAEVVLALDEMGRSLESEWHTKPDIDAPLKFVRLEMPERTASPTDPKASTQTNIPMSSDKGIDESSLIGTWTSKRPDAPSRERVWGFNEDGTLSISTPAISQSVKGNWRIDGKRVYFTDPSSDPKNSTPESKWFEVIQIDDRKMDVRVMGERPYTWIRGNNASEASPSSTNATDQPNGVTWGSPKVLFDGSSLTDWNFDSRYWSLSNGMIIGLCPAKLGRGGTFLATKEKFKDFTATVRFRVEYGNSGIHFRCQKNTGSNQEYDGYQSDLGPGFEGLRACFAGSSDSQPVALPDPMQLTQVRGRWVDGGWNEYTITCVGNGYSCAVNGITIMSGEIGQASHEGHLAMHLHGNLPTKLLVKRVTITQPQ